MWSLPGCVPQASEAGSHPVWSSAAPRPWGATGGVFSQLPSHILIVLFGGKCRPGCSVQSWAAGDCSLGVSSAAGCLSPCYKTVEKPLLLAAGNVRYHGKKQIKKLWCEPKRQASERKAESVCKISLVSHHFDAETSEVICSQKKSDV